jgi:hypothetical protein
MICSGGLSSRRSSRRDQSGSIGSRLREGSVSSRGPSSRSPLATIRNMLSGSGRCNSRAFGASANSHKSTSSGVVRMTGMALGWIGATTAFASVVRKPNNSCCPSTGALFGPRTPRQGVQRPANDRCHLVGENSGEQGQVACSIVARAEPVADRGLAFGQTVEIAHCGGP